MCVLVAFENKRLCLCGVVQAASDTDDDFSSAEEDEAQVPKSRGKLVKVTLKMVASWSEKLQVLFLSVYVHVYQLQSTLPTRDIVVDLSATLSDWRLVPYASCEKLLLRVSQNT